MKKSIFKIFLLSVIAVVFAAVPCFCAVANASIQGTSKKNSLTMTVIEGQDINMNLARDAAKYTSLSKGDSWDYYSINVSDHKYMNITKIYKNSVNIRGECAGSVTIKVKSRTGKSTAVVKVKVIGNLKRKHSNIFISRSVIRKVIKPADVKKLTAAQKKKYHIGEKGADVFGTSSLKKGNTSSYHIFVNVKYNGKYLTLNKDYVIYYTATVPVDKSKPCTGTVEVRGKGNYYGSFKYSYKDNVQYYTLF